MKLPIPGAKKHGYKDLLANLLDRLPHNVFERIAGIIVRNKKAVENCQKWAVVGTCESGEHQYARQVLCGRDYCPECGKRGSDAHKRRAARVKDKFRQLDQVGYFTIGFRKSDREQFRSTAALSKAGKIIAKTLKAQGFLKGMRRWDWFGDPKCPKCRRPGRWDAKNEKWQCKKHGEFTLDQVAPESMAFHPHVNAIVSGRFIEAPELTAIQKALSLALGIGWDADIDEKTGKIVRIRQGIIMNYQYVELPPDKESPEYRKKVGKILHIAKYIMKPTFLRQEWDIEMAAALSGFRNGSWWGKWDGPMLWDFEGPEGEEVWYLISLEKGYCPLDGSRIEWRGKVQLMPDPAAGDICPIGGGYWQILSYESPMSKKWEGATA